MDRKISGESKKRDRTNPGFLTGKDFPAHPFCMEGKNLPLVTSAAIHSCIAGTIQ
jgi:hypothetical protein